MLSTQKRAAAVYLYQADSDGEWGKLRFDFENGAAEIVRLADWDTTTSNIFAKTPIRFVQGLPEARLLNSVVVPFEMDVLERPLPLTKAAKESNGNSSHTISLRQTECRKTGETITAAVYEYLVDNDGEWGELRFDFENGTVTINKSYQRLHREDVVTPPKTEKSNRTIKMPQLLCDEMREYLEMFYSPNDSDRIFPISKSYLHHEMDRGSKSAGVKRIRIHDLRHSHVSLLINQGYQAAAIADRVGHETVEITDRYTHIYPSKQNEMANTLDELWKERK